MREGAFAKEDHVSKKKVVQLGNCVTRRILEINIGVVYPSSAKERNHS